MIQQVKSREEVVKKQIIMYNLEYTMYNCKLLNDTVRLPKVSTNGITQYNVILPRLGCKMNNISLIRVELLLNLCSCRKKSLTLRPKTELCALTLGVQP